MGCVTVRRDEGSGMAFPRSLLKPGDSALVLFAAGFHGAQDALWIADAGLEADCVDIDDRKLDEMAAEYPATWRFTAMDVFDFAEAAEAAGERWDVVSIDCPTNLFDRCAEHMKLWCALARKAVILGVGQATEVAMPPGWRTTDIRQRSGFAGGVYWLVAEPRA